MNKITNRNIFNVVYRNYTQSEFLVTLWYNLPIEQYTVLLSIGLFIPLSPGDVLAVPPYTRLLLDVHITNTLLYHSNLRFSSRMPELELLIIDCFIKQLIAYDIVDSILFVLLIFIEKICPRHFRRWAGYYAHTRKKKKDLRF